MKWILVLTLALAGAAVLSSCHAHRRGHGPLHAHPEWVEVRGHAHDDHCGHYHHRGKWYHWEGHRHGHGCGHVHRNGIWVVID